MRLPPNGSIMKKAPPRQRLTAIFRQDRQLF
jgi:hypothetical protein